MRKTFCLLVVFIGLFTLSQAQSVPIGFVTGLSTITPDTVGPGDTLTYTMFIQNKDSATGDSISGSLNMLRKALPAPVVIDTLFSTTINGVLMPGDSAAYTVTDIASVTNLKGGLNLSLIHI